MTDPYAYPPRALDLAAAARYFGLTPGAFNALVEDGRLPRPRRLGEAVIWDRMALDTAFDVIPADEQPARKQRGHACDVEGMTGPPQRLPAGDLRHQVSKLT